MDTTLCTLSQVLACRIDDFSIGKVEDVYGRPEEVYSYGLWAESLAPQGIYIQYVDICVRVINMVL